MDADTLHNHLTVRGLQVLGVTTHHRNPNIRLVYLHGNAYQTAEALETIAAIPTVTNVIESIPSSAILLVHIHPPPRKG